MRRAAVLALGALLAAGPAAAQNWIGQPPFTPETQAAVIDARRGDNTALKALAEAGRADAQFFAGTFLIFGVQGFPKDGRKGCAYQTAASASRSDAMHLVGECYQFGYGGEQDLEKAIAAFHKAGEMGLAKSRCAEGNVLFQIGRESQRAVALCEAGARAGDEDAQTDLGNIYLTGKHVARDPVAARGWYEKAAAKGQRNAAFTLGLIYWNGDGVARNTEVAGRYWRTAYTAGRLDAAVYLGDEAMQRAMQKLDGNQAALVVAGKAQLDQSIVAEALNWYDKALVAAPPQARGSIEDRIKKAKLFVRPGAS